MMMPLHQIANALCLIVLLGKAASYTPSSRDDGLELAGEVFGEFSRLSEIAWSRFGCFC